MINFFKKNYSLLLFFLFFLSVTSIYFLPFLKHPAFNLIDDGMSLQISKEIISGNYDKLVETQNGRVRPLYWLYFLFIYSLSGINPLGFWISQSVIFSLTLFSIWYLLTNKQNRNKWESYVIALALSILFFIPAVSENLFRLGTAEVRQMLLIIWFVIWMKNNIEKKSKDWVGFLIFLLAILTKETSILLVPMVFTFMFPYIVTNYKKYNTKICLLLFFSFFSFIFLLLISAMKEHSSYSSNFNISFDQIKMNFLISRLGMNEIYYLLIALLTLGFIRMIIYFVDNKVFNTKKENYIFEIFINFWKVNSLEISILTGLLISLFFVFSWEHQLGRYYYPIYIFLFIFTIIELKKSIKLFATLKTYKYKASMIFLPIIVLFILYETLFQKTVPHLKSYLLNNYDVKKLWYSDYQNSYSIINILVSENTNTMYTLLDDYEVVYELGLFLNKLDFNSNKIRIYSPNFKIAQKYEYFSYSDDVTEEFLKDQNKDSILVTVELNDLDLDKKLYNKEIVTNDFLKKYSQRSSFVIWRKK